MANHPAPRTISATEAANNFGRLIDEAARGISQFVVTRMGRPRAVVIGIDQYLELMDALETFEEQNDPEFMAGLAEAREDIRLGRTYTLEELDRLMGFTEDELNVEP
jgi:prevent-host-death family protein